MPLAAPREGQEDYLYDLNFNRLLQFSDGVKKAYKYGDNNELTRAGGVRLSPTVSLIALLLTQGLSACSPKQSLKQAQPSSVVSLSADEVAAAMVENPSLLELAKSRPDLRWNTAKGRQLVQEWAHADFGVVYLKLNEFDKQLVAERASNMIDDLLAERNFPGPDED